jgi:hypothetical protein
MNKKTTKTKKVSNIKKQSDKVEGSFIVTFKTFTNTYISTGKTIEDALNNLNVDGKIANVSVMTVSNGLNKRERVINFIQAHRLFSKSNVIRTIALKNMALLFGNF